MSAEILSWATQALAVPISTGLFLNGVEEMLIDVQYFARGLYRKERRAITAEELAAAPSKRIAIMVAAWDEADVIEHMLEHNRRTLDYDPEMFALFCGTYQNDPATQAKVDLVAARYPNVHKVVVPHDGPTSKADCLNWIYAGIIHEEKRTGQRFDILLMHDSEDLIHPMALRLYSLLVPKYEFVQTPVFSLPLKHRDVIASTYIDEFAEHHLKDMLVREAIGGLVPSAGVGSAFARDAFEEIAAANEQHPFNVDSLTEDYEVGLKFRLAGKRVHFACRSLQKTRTVPKWFGRGERKIVEEEFIATREYFPNKLRSSIRQRARWITGIALQTWRQIGWKGSAAVRYCLWRDRKVVVTNSLLLGAYTLVALMTFTSACSATPVEAVPSYSALWWLMGFNMFVMIWRASMKMNFVGRLYGVGHALASTPRLIVGNIIGLAATGRAVKQYAHHLWSGQPLRWAKTAHEYPTFEQLAEHQRRLGEFLVAKSRLAQADVDDALAIQAGIAVPLGEVLSASGMMRARDVALALSENLAVPYAEPNPEDVPLALLRTLPERLAVALDAMPVALDEDGVAVIAMTRAPTPDDERRLADVMGTPIRIVLAERETIRRGRWRAYRRLLERPRAHQRLGEALLASGDIDLAQLDAALEEQLETGEKLGELLSREGTVPASKIADALWAPRAAYRTVRPEDVDLIALGRIGYGLASFYELVPVSTPRGLALASPHPIHVRVAASIAERLGRSVTPVLASGLEVHVALAIASRLVWPVGIAFGWPGLAGEELGALLEDPERTLEASAAAHATESSGVSPIEFLEQHGRLDADTAARLHARSLGLPIDPSTGHDPEALLPPELVEDHAIRVLDSNAHGVVLGAPHPTPQLAHHVAKLFIDRAVAWRVLVGPARDVAFEEAV